MCFIKMWRHHSFFNFIFSVLIYFFCVLHGSVSVSIAEYLSLLAYRTCHLSIITRESHLCCNLLAALLAEYVQQSISCKHI